MNNQDIPNTLTGLFYDKSVRNLIRNKDRGALELLNVSQDDNTKVKVLTSTKNVTYVAMPVRFGQSDLDDVNQQLEAINAADKVSTAGTISTTGCATSAGTICSTVSSASTASTATSLGSAGSVQMGT